MLVFGIILCLSILFMYAAIHPDGLVIFSKSTVFNTHYPTVPTLVNNENRALNRTSPLGVTVMPEDPWWIRLVNETQDSSLEPSNDNLNLNQGIRVRVKIANKTTTETQEEPSKSPTFISTLPRPKSKPSLWTTPKTIPTEIPDEYDEKTIVYNYKSYENSVIRVNP